jgi:hypothetical protein
LHKPPFSQKADQKVVVVAVHASHITESKEGEKKTKTQAEIAIVCSLRELEKLEN